MSMPNAWLAIFPGSGKKLFLWNGKRWTVIAALSLASCGTPPQSVGDHVIYRDRLVEVPRPCPVKKPVRPAPLARPLPSDPGALVSLLVAKLAEYAGPGGYADKAESSLNICTKPN